MKTINALAMLVAIMLFSCTPKTETLSVDLDAVKDTLDQLAEKYAAAVIARDIEVLDQLLADDGLFCGTDPSEIYDKIAVIGMWTELKADTTTDYSFNTEQRIIRPAADGRSAIVTEHVRAGGWSPGTMVRQSYHLIRSEQGWVIDYASWGFIVKNEDVPMLNMLMK